MFLSVRTPWRLAAILLLAALLMANVYRAATQSISHDEAVLFQWFLSGDWAQVFGSPMGNHHPLHTLLAKATIGAFGLSEFSLRVTTLIGGVFYFYAVFQLAALLFGEGWLFLLCTAFLTANPFVLDYLCCARGYSPALGCYLYALYCLARYLSNGTRRPHTDRLLNVAGVCTGLSIGFNVIMIFPVAALTAALFAIVLAETLLVKPEAGAAREGGKARKQRRRRGPEAMPARGLVQALLHFVVPTAAIGGFISTLPTRLVQLEINNLGPASLAEILDGIVRPSLLHAPGRPGLLAWVPAGAAIRFFIYVAAPAGVAVLAAVAIWLLWSRCRARSFESLAMQERFLILLGITAPAVLATVLLSRYGFEVPYPEKRTVMYWIPLLSLGCVALVERLLAGGRRSMAMPLAAFAALCTVQYLTQFNTRYYDEWRYSAATRDMMEIVRGRGRTNPSANVRLGATWQLEPGINFYRAMWGLNWVDEVFREPPDGSRDYFLLIFDDVHLVERRGLKVLFRDPLSGSVLAVQP